MTTTPNPTEAQIIADAITAYWADEERSGPNRGPLAHDLACGEAATAALRAHGLLSAGAPNPVNLDALAERLRMIFWNVYDPDSSTYGNVQEALDQAMPIIAESFPEGAPSEELDGWTEAERDAAVAAIERVRAEADAYEAQPDVMEPCGAVAQALRTALDGAPEPEGGGAQ